MGAFRHARAGRVDWHIVRWMGPPSVAGAFVGGYAAGFAPERALLALVAGVVFYSGLDMLLGLAPAPRDARDARVVATLAGAAIGLLGGAVGLILGTLRLPALVKAVGLSPHKAVGTNLVVGFALGVFGFLGHALRLEVEWAILAVSVPATIPGAWLGARLTGRLSERALRRAIGLVLLAVAVAIALAAR